MRSTVWALLLLSTLVNAQPDLSVGRKRYEAQCAGCHGADAAGGERGPSLFREGALRPDEQLRDIIRTGRPAAGMPAFDLPEPAMAELLGYLRSLRPGRSAAPVNQLLAATKAVPFSDIVKPRPGDWPANAAVCGQWLAPAPDWQPPPALRGFLAAGEAPVYIGFGSMTGFDKARLLAALIDGMAGRRAVLHPGWSGLDARQLPPNFHAIGDTPHDWLFPQMALVVHHGGSGTSHSAARAGVPSVVVPFAGDQAFWAHHLAQSGVAPPAVAGSRFGAEDLARGIAFAHDPQVRARARALGERMRAEDGLGTAVRAIEQILAR